MSEGLRYARDIADGLEISPEAERWFRAGIRRHLDDGVDLEVALQINGTARVRARDRALLRAAQIIDDGRGLSPWQLAGELEKELQYFEATRLKLLRRRCVDVCTPLDLALFEAFSVCGRQIRDKRRLYDFLRDNNPIANATPAASNDG